MKKLLLYLILFLIGVFLYYVLNNRNIEKLNIGGQIFDKPRPYSAQLIYPEWSESTLNEKTYRELYQIAISMEIDQDLFLPPGSAGYLPDAKNKLIPLI